MLQMLERVKELSSISGAQSWAEGDTALLKCGLRGWIFLSSTDTTMGMLEVER